MPSHAHNIWDKQSSNWTKDTRTVYRTNIDTSSTADSHYTQLLSNKIGIQNTGSSSEHTHAVSETTHTHTVSSAEGSNLPPWYSLVYCVKLV